MGEHKWHCVLKDSGLSTLFALLYRHHGFIVPPVPELGLSPGQIPPQDRTSFLLYIRCTQKLSLCLPSFPHNHPFPGWVSAVYICRVHPLSRSLLLPPPPPLVGPQDLVPQHVRCHPSSLMCKDALRWFVSCEPGVDLIFAECTESVRTFSEDQCQATVLSVRGNVLKYSCS